jgi:uncharacterized protein (DUF427 family)
VPRAVWNGVTIAQSPTTVTVEGNQYFPPESVQLEYLFDSPRRSLCPWKGVARYYCLDVGGQVNPDAAWCYPRPTFLARRIKGHVAFWNGVRIEPDDDVAPPTDADSRVSPRIPVLRIGALSGVVGMICCVGPTMLALIGIVSATTAYSWAENLYGGYAWWFRAGGLVVMVGLLLATLRRQQQCSLAGIRRVRSRLVTLLATAVTTYGLLYAATTWLGHLSRTH